MLTFLINDSLLMALTSLTMFSTAYSLRLFSMSPAKSQHILHLTFKMIATAPSPLPPLPNTLFGIPPSYWNDLLFKYKKTMMDIFCTHIFIFCSPALRWESTNIFWFRSYQRRRCLKANKYCAFWISLAVISAVAAVLVFALIETTSNYQERITKVLLLPHFLNCSTLRIIE